VTGVDAAVLRSWSASIADLQQSTRARKQAAVAAFLRWAVRHELIDANPMDRFDRISVPAGVPRPVDPKRIDAVIAVIAKRKLRDRLLFEFLKALGCRVSEALGVHVEDLDLTPATSTSWSTAKAAGSRSCSWTTRSSSTCSAGSCARPPTCTTRCSARPGTGPAGR
jgi:site-specific recombinase XerD